MIGEKNSPSFAYVLCGVLIRLWQDLPFHKELEQLDVQLECHAEEGRVPLEQVPVEAGGEAGGGHTGALLPLGPRDTHQHKANTAAALPCLI